MSLPSARPIRGADGELTLDAFAARGTNQGNNAVQIDRDEFMSLPWDRGGTSTTLEFTHNTESTQSRRANAESLWIYRIPHVGPYSEQIYRIINDCWSRLPDLWKQGCWVQLRFSFLKDNPRFIQPTDANYPLQGSGNPLLKYSVNYGEVDEGPEYRMKYLPLPAKSYDNHKFTQLAFQRGSNLESRTLSGRGE